MKEHMRGKRVFTVYSASDVEGLDLWPGDAVRVSSFMSGYHTTAVFRMTGNGTLERCGGTVTYRRKGAA